MSEQNAVTEEGGPDPVALAAAMNRSSPDVNSELVAYLRDQRSHMHETLKQIHLDIFEKWLGVALRLATLCVGLAAAAGVVMMVWEARQSAGLIVEPFAMPPDLAARGLSGQVVASQLLDKLTIMQNATRSYRAPKTFANNWGDDVKVEIPETGISIGELRRFLREWLGHDTHISGEVWRTETGIAISARAGGDSGKVFAGPQSEFDALMQKAAEHVFSRTQPFRYGNYLRPLDRFQESRASYLSQINADSTQEQGWAWYGIAVLDAVWLGKTKEGLWGYRKAIAAYPELTIAWSGVGAAEAQLGHSEAALQARRRVEELISRDGMADIAPRSVAYVRAQWVHSVPLFTGDYAEAMRRGRMGAAMPDQQGFQVTFRNTIARALAGRHEVSAAQFALPHVPPTAGDGAQITIRLADVSIKAAGEDWRGVAEAEAATERWVSGRIRTDIPLALGVALRPWGALAKAKLGDVAGAQTLIATTPTDCYDCVRVRAAIAEMATQPGVADYWFARAIHDGPSIPFAYYDWGMALLARGQPDKAIEKFKLSNRKGPHFADPLEGWGEALMAQNQSHLALAKFKEAEKYAPNWGRLHLKWGEALVYAGKPDEAKAQFARAAALDLRASEKSELQHRI